MPVRFTPMILHDLSSALVRSNPDYRFVPFSGLAAAELESLGELPSDQNLAGVLFYHGTGGLGAKAVDADTVTLFTQCTTSQPVAALLRQLPPAKRDHIIAGLILDAVLEVGVGDGFVSSAAAYTALIACEDSTTDFASLERLSLAAIKHCQNLTMLPATDLAAKLYFYNRHPATRQWRELWPDPQAVLNSLRASSGEPLHRHLGEHYHCPSPTIVSPGWLVWIGRRWKRTSSDNAPIFKLYLSPAPQHFQLVFGEATSLLSSSGCGCFKIGMNAYNLLRPDKFVLYFDQMANLLAYSTRLEKRLTGVSAHGVPFSAQLDGQGCLSWGVDPPHQKTPPWISDESWRIWICNRLAVGLKSAAGCATASVPPWRFALTKLWFAGIDTRDWTPRAFPAEPPMTMSA